MSETCIAINDVTKRFREIGYGNICTRKARPEELSFNIRYISLNSGWKNA